MSTQPKQTTLSVYFEGKDISGYVERDLLSFSYTDKETDETDDIRITLKDQDGVWASSWCPNGGETVKATIIDGYVDGTVSGTLYCGTFKVDSLRCSGAPRVMEIAGVSVPLDKPIRRKNKKRAWEKTSLKAIHNQLAEEAGLTPMWSCGDDIAPEYDRVDQKDESDLAFLLRLAKDEGLSVKVSSDKLIVFDQSMYEKKDPVDTLVLNESPILSWSFSTQKGQTYKSVKVSYRDPKKKVKTTSASYYNADFEKVTTAKTKGKNPAVMEYIYTDPNADPNGQEFVLKKKAKSVAEAERLAKAKLRELNLRAVTGSLSVVGNINYVAGVVLELSGFGSWDGRFYVESASHSVTNSGYTTGLEVRRVNTNY